MQQQEKGAKTPTPPSPSPPSTFSTLRKHT